MCRVEESLLDRIYMIFQDYHVNPVQSCKSCKNSIFFPDLEHPLDRAQRTFANVFVDDDLKLLFLQ